MEVRIEGEREGKVIEKGDIIINEQGHAGIVTKVDVYGSKGLKAVLFDGEMFDSMPQEGINRGAYKLFKSNKYELVLRRKVDHE